MFEGDNILTYTIFHKDPFLNVTPYVLDCSIYLSMNHADWLAFFTLRYFDL